MTDNKIFIKNPLTIIAIFAGIAEVGGTVVLPLIEKENQLIFIYFLIFFPCLLIALFFLTLNFNNKVLYAPSDYKNEEHYLSMFTYDHSRQKKIEVTGNTEKMLEVLNENFIQYKKEIHLKFQNLIVAHPQITTTESTSQDKTIETSVSVLNMPKANELSGIFNKKGFIAEISEAHTTFNFLNHHEAIWLGAKVPFQKAKEIILMSKAFYPHLNYISLSYRNKDVPEFIHYQTFIGGATSTALEEGLQKLTDSDWKALESVTSIEDIYKIIGYKNTNTN